jgi:hypothetical protein
LRVPIIDDNEDDQETSHDLPGPGGISAVIDVPGAGIDVATRFRLAPAARMLLFWNGVRARQELKPWISCLAPATLDLANEHQCREG